MLSTPLATERLFVLAPKRGMLPSRSSGKRFGEAGSHLPLSLAFAPALPDPTVATPERECSLICVLLSSEKTGKAASTVAPNGTLPAPACSDAFHGFSASALSLGSIPFLEDPRCTGTRRGEQQYSEALENS